jgi:Ca-activated chloride channel family protein
MLVLDVSGSMQGEPIVAATAATQEFISRLDPNDEVGLVTFSDRVAMHVPVTTVASVAETLAQRVDGLIASGGTNLNGAVCYAAKNMMQIQEDDAQKGENRLYALVLLSDGKDNKGVVTETRMLQDCLSVGAESEPVKVFSIAFGSEADTAVLERIAKETTGGVFKADPGSISAAYLRISAEQ